MTTNSTPFAKAVSAFLEHSAQTESKYRDVFLSMLEMELTFSPEWTEKFLKTSGAEKTDMIESTFRKIELEGYDQLLETSREKLKKDATEADIVAKEQAQKKVHALNMMLKTVAFALAYFQLKGVEKHDKKPGGRLAYVIDGAWISHKRGESFNAIVQEGREEARKAGWTTPQANHVKSPSSGQVATTGPASEGTSVADTVNKVVSTGGMVQPNNALVQTCDAIGTILSTRNYHQLKVEEQTSIIQLCYTLIPVVFADKTGKLDKEDLLEWLANREQPQDTAQAA